MELLGEIEKISWRHAVPLGHWMVLFKHSRPLDIVGPGHFIWKWIHTPLTGGKVALLDSRPQMIILNVENATTVDGFNIESMVFRLHVRLTPEWPGAKAYLLDRMMRDGNSFVEPLESHLRSELEQDVRKTLLKCSMRTLRHEGSASVFSHLANIRYETIPCFGAAGLDAVEWRESSTARSVLDTEEQSLAESSKSAADLSLLEERSKLQIRKIELESEAALKEEQLKQSVEEVKLNAAARRAKDLNIPLVAVAERELYERDRERIARLIGTALENPAAATIFKSRPELLRLMGFIPDTAPRQESADYVADSRAVEPTDDLAGSRGKTDQAEYVRQNYSVDLGLAAIWRKTYNDVSLEGSGFHYTEPSGRAVLLCIASRAAELNKEFQDHVNDHYSGRYSEVNTVEVIIVPNGEFEEIVQACVLAKWPNIKAHCSLFYEKKHLECSLKLEGENQVQVYEELTNPETPFILALESLVKHEIRFRIEACDV